MLNRLRQSSSTKSEGENPYWVSFSDIMAGLLVIFILALITLMIQQKISTIRYNAEIKRLRETSFDPILLMHASFLPELEKPSFDPVLLKYSSFLPREEAPAWDMIVGGITKLSEIEQLRIKILNEISNTLKREGIRIELSDNSTVLRIPEDTLAFETSKWEIPLESKESLARIGIAIYDAITKYDRLDFIETIFIEGHTDSVPLQTEMGNWGLSTYRAISVWQHWEEKSGGGNKLSSLKNHSGKPIFSVSGYEATRRLILDDNDEESRRKNRRIDIRFTMKSISKSDLEDIIEEIELK